MSTNPLTAYSRIAKLQINLPSGGRFADVTEGQSNLTGDEIQIKPMTGVDELYLKNPDALLSGEAVAKCIQSCTGIQDVYSLTNTDVNTLLLAIRYASYGQFLQLDVKCPVCEEEFLQDVDIEVMLDTIEPLKNEYTCILSSSDLVVSVRPHTFEMAQKIALLAFSETQALGALEGVAEVGALAAFSRSYRKIADLSVNAIINSIISVTTPDGIVITDTDEINEFVREVSKDEMATITDILLDANKTSYDGSSDIKCINEECEHVWNQVVEVNTTNFFDRGSRS